MYPAGLFANCMEICSCCGASDLEVIRRSIAFMVKKILPPPVHDWVSNSDKGLVTYLFLPDVTYVSEQPDVSFALNLGFLWLDMASLMLFCVRGA